MKRFSISCAFVALLFSGAVFSTFAHAAQSRAAVPQGCAAIVKARIVALEQAYLLNRFSAYVPAGMMFVLEADIESLDKDAEPKPGRVKLRDAKRPRPLVLRVNKGDCLEVTFTNLLAEQRGVEGGTPPDNDGRLPGSLRALPGRPGSSRLVEAEKVSVDAPRTRSASFHVTGLSVLPIAPQSCPRDAACGGDGSNVGLPEQQGVVFHPDTSMASRAAFSGLGSLTPPGHTTVTLWKASDEGAFFAHSTAAPVGGEGDGGQIGLGLFGAVIVEPTGSRWYRSQVTHDELSRLRGPDETGRHPYRAIDYDRVAQVKGHSRPVLAMLDADRNIVHSDLNAIIVRDEHKDPAADSQQCQKTHFASSCGRPYREFTVIFHDEVDAEQAFQELADENNPLHQVRDGMGVNYGVAGMGAPTLTTPQFNTPDILKPGPANHCPECRAEEFFLSSWANGDPALILKYDDKDEPIGARYPDDPSNVHHSYLGDPVRFHNIHAGPKETHVFHLHAHQWVLDESDPHSSYLDSQTIAPGATFSYGIAFGGSGNRNYAPGDSIFHCHLYPHFAQGMWELWRVHDAFVDGKPGLFDPETPIGVRNDPGSMNLPDPVVKAGIETPAVVPIPGSALAPMPSAQFRGYPFYIPGKPGHRPPQPPLDMDVAAADWTDMASEPAANSIVNGGLPRHVVGHGELERSAQRSLEKGGEAAQLIAARVAAQDPAALDAFAWEWSKIGIEPLAHSGEARERAAMAFHEGALAAPGLERVILPNAPHPEWWVARVAYKTDIAAALPMQKSATRTPYFHVNGRPRAPGAPFADPCPQDAPHRDYRGAFIQTELTYNKHGWFDPQGRIVILENDIKDVIDPDHRSKIPEPLFFRANSGECITFKSSNFVPSALNIDDFQIYTPTDTIGQHIHLVKFDVTSSDGSGNGWNYEDATFSPDEVRERIFAWNRANAATGADKLRPRAHPLFLPGGDIYEAARSHPEHPFYARLLEKGRCPEQKLGESDPSYEKRLGDHHPYCGAQRTTQRWWADPILDRSNDKDDTLRTVFTHDHMGPSSHQQHGLYAGLVIEPANSVWTRIGASLTSAELRAASASALGCDAPSGDARRSPICDKLLGGSDLAVKTAASLLAPQNRIEGVVEPRAPLRLQSDGGPTATMANIVAPGCTKDSDSNPLQLDDGRNHPPQAPCEEKRLTNDTRREFMLALADFGVAYNMALEPINPEPRGDSGRRDESARRFGRRHVAQTPARPLGISSEDPGSQYFNYRHEPLALRVSEETSNEKLGGWDYRQSILRADLATKCGAGSQDCLGDPANAFSTLAHWRRDRKLATEPMSVSVSPAIREFARSRGEEARLDAVVASAENWRRRFNCMIYPESMMGAAQGCAPDIIRLEPWRVFGDPATPILPAFEGDPIQIRLIQGAQEAQHIFTMNGVKWPRQPGLVEKNNSGWVNTQPLGISEHFEFEMSVPGFKMPHIDYLYFGSSVDQLWDGMWGVMRSYLPSDDPGRRRHVHTPVAKAVDPRLHEFFDLTNVLAPLPGVDRSAANETLRAAEPDDWTRLHQKFEQLKAKRDAKHDRDAEHARDVRRQRDARDKPAESVAAASGEDADLCVDSPKGHSPANHHRFFDVSAVRVCDLYDNCGKSSSKGVVYSERFDIHDEKALIYVLEEEGVCARASVESAIPDCEAHENSWRAESNRQTLARLRGEFAAGRPVEPLVLRAAAGDCLHVNLRNLLPARLDDGPKVGVGDAPAEVPEARAYHNLLPMITDGFNMNQFRMSSSVGLSAPRVAQHPAHGDGSNIGLNAPIVVARETAGRQLDLKRIFEKTPDSLHRQGSLAPPCVGRDDVDGERESRCRASYIWSLVDFVFERPDEYRPVEFGALPLRGLGDPIKHPAHGLVGALTVGPEGSRVCAQNRFAREIRLRSGATRAVPGGVSAEICRPDGRRYVDHVLVMQDAVNATRGGLPLPNLSGAEEPDDYGVKAINYKTEPLWARRGGDPSIGFSDRNGDDFAGVLTSATTAPGDVPFHCLSGAPPVLAMRNPCDPETPVLAARPGETVRLGIVHPGGHTRQQGLALSGHAWNPYPWAKNSSVLDPAQGSHIRQGVYNAFGPMMGISLEIAAGGEARTAMDYLFRSQASFLFDGGQWGILRVRPDESPRRPAEP
ncbi:hypothetical protein [Methylosinus sp. KRF6]|uniref:hypothetical protein n=1 Tax=Methylosinus sp. KRF6 TaxID=2846853 RepID=UPI001C0CD31A|nr:hypothetical protein [Methylosinus sp. KRF6]MBU3891016.1 hypothetical protein [Methylosinus sp. KRF6]